MNSTKLIYSNEKGRFDLPVTTALFPSGVTSGDTAHPVVFHPASGKATIGTFPAPDTSFSRYQLLTRAQVLDTLNDQDNPGFYPGWTYGITDSQVGGIIYVEAVGPRSLATTEAWRIEEIPQQGGGAVEQATPVFYDVATDSISDRRLDESNYAKLDRSNQFTDDQFVQDPNGTAGATYGASRVLLSTDTGNALFRPSGFEFNTSQGGYLGSIYTAKAPNGDDVLVLNAEHVQVPAPTAPQDAVTKSYVDAALNAYSGGTYSGSTGLAGDTITSFTQGAGKFTLTTNQGSFIADLNQPFTQYLGNQVLRDPDMNLPFGNDPSPNSPGWASTGSWYESNGQGFLNYGADFLFQDLQLGFTGTYEVKVTVSSVTAGALMVLVVPLGGSAYPVIYAPGVYTFYTRLNAGPTRFHLRGSTDTGNNNVITVESCTLRAVILGSVYGDDKFVHLAGDETIAGTKTFSDHLKVNTQGTVGLDIQYSNGQYDNGIIIQNTNGGQGAYTGVLLKNYDNSSQGVIQVLGSNYGYAPLANTVIFGSQSQTRLAFIANTSGAGSAQDVYFQTLSSHAAAIYINAAAGDFVGIGTVTPGEKLDVAGNVQAQYFIGDGSRLTNLPSGGASQVITSQTLTVQSDGAQTVTFPDVTAIYDILRVQVQENAAGGGTDPIYTRDIWEPYCTVSGNQLTISADANLQKGDNLFVKISY